MGQEGNSSPSLLGALRPERLLVVVLLVVTLGFGMTYTRLLYQYRQALGEKARAAALVHQEEARQRDLRTLDRLADQDWYREAEIARLRGAHPSSSTTGANGPATRTGQGHEGHGRASADLAVPPWQQWLHAFHIRPPGENRSPD